MKSSLDHKIISAHMVISGILWERQLLFKKLDEYSPPDKLSHQMRYYGKWSSRRTGLISSVSSVMPQKHAAPSWNLTCRLVIAWAARPSTNLTLQLWGKTVGQQNPQNSHGQFNLEPIICRASGWAGQRRVGIEACPVPGVSYSVIRGSNHPALLQSKSDSAALNHCPERQCLF